MAARCWLLATDVTQPCINPTVTLVPCPTVHACTIQMQSQWSFPKPYVKYFFLMMAEQGLIHVGNNIVNKQGNLWSLGSAKKWCLLIIVVSFCLYVPLLHPLCRHSQEPSKFHSTHHHHQIESSPFGFGSPVTLKDTEMSSPRATAMSMSGRFMNMAGFPPRTLPGATIPTVADVSTWPYAFDARQVYKPASFSVTSVSTRLYTPDSSNLRTFGVKK